MYQQTPVQPTPNEVLLIQKNNAIFQENTAKTQNEQALYVAWKQAEYEKNIITNRLNTMQQQFEQMQRDFTDLKSKYPTTQQEKPETIQYFTDEEELAEETDWIRKKNRKKRKMNTSLSPPQQIPKDAEKRSEQAKPKKEIQPPPIIVDGITNFNELHDLISKIIIGFQIKIINDKNIKINVPDGESYKELTKMLTDKDYSWYSYENKQNRPIKVMAINLHHSCNTDEIVKELRGRGYKLLEATRKLKYKTKQPLNMFMLSFKNDENADKIFSITDIMGIRVQIQPIRKSKLVPQCKRCQTYGHTQRYCAKEPRCVRCTGKHHTTNCEKPKNTIPKCVHCGEGHPANYRGCIIAKEFQKIKNKQLNRTKLPTKPQRHNKEKKVDLPKLEQDENQIRTYSQVARKNLQKEKAHSQQQQTTKPNNDDTLLQILETLKKMDERISLLEKREQGAIPKTRNG